MASRIKKSLESMVLALSLMFSPQVNASKGPLHNRYYIAEHKSEARAAVLGADLVLGCLKSGIGNADAGFFSSCVKGALGGSVMFAGEYLASYNKYPMLGASGKLVHDLGVSMSDNVMRGEGMFSQYRTDFGPLVFTFDSPKSFDMSFAMLPLGGVIGNLVSGNKLDFKNSLYNFTPVFRMKSLAGVGGVRIGGYVTGNVISYHPDRFGDNPEVLSHEMNHVLFWSKLRFSGDLFCRAQDMDKLCKFWNPGHELSYVATYLPVVNGSNLYYYHPMELEAFAMERGKLEY